MKIQSVVVAICLAALVAVPACASDLSFGSTARSVSMGGAGLALADNPGTTVVLNPAAPAASGSRTRFIFPAFEVHSTGASFSDLTDSIDKLASDNTDDALSLVNDFATHDTTLTFSALTGFAGPFGVTVGGEAQALIQPGAAAAEWAGQAQTFDDLTFNLNTVAITNANYTTALAKANDFIASGDPQDLADANTALTAYMGDLSQNFVRGNFVYGPGVSLSHGYTTASGGQLWLGTTVQFLKSEAHTWQVQAAAPAGISVAGGAASTSLDFSVVEQTVRKSTSTKADVGLIYRPKDSKIQYGAVIENFIEPSLDGVANAKTDRSISVGIAFLPIKNFVWAADLVNINGANGEDAQLRMGGELRLGRFLSARAGYSGSNWTYGIGVFGINLAWAGDSAQLITNVLKF